MPKPIFSLSTEGSNPAITSKQALETEVNRVAGLLYDQANPQNAADALESATAAQAAADLAAQRADDVAAANGFRDIASVEALRADTGLTYGTGSSQVQVGEQIRTRREGLVYEVIGGAASGYHIQSAGFVRFKLVRSVTNGRGRLRAASRGAVMAHIGDSIMLGAGEWGVGYKNNWLVKGGPFEGWTSYNLASNGSPASAWAGRIDTGDQGEQPQDYLGTGNPGYNPWAAVNANPDLIVMGLGTNDLRMDGSQARIDELRRDLHRLVSFLLEKTRAMIWLRMPPCYVYRNPDPGGFTNFTSATDAANRSAALRAIYLEWQAVSDRVQVFDLQKALFGLRQDNINTATEPEGQVDFYEGGQPRSLFKDSLHPTNLGQTRVAQIMARSFDPSLPYTSEVKSVPQSAYKDARISTLVEVKGGGAGYIDIYADPIRRLTGSLQRGYPRGPLSNIKQAETLAAAGAASILRDILESRRFSLSYATDGAVDTVLDGFTYAYNAVDGISDYWRVSCTGTFSRSGFATAFVSDRLKLPRYPAQELPITIQFSGTSGAVPLPVLTALPAFSASTVSGTRRVNNTAAAVDIYACNRFDQAYTDAGGTVLNASPGRKLGTVNFPNGHYGVTSWTASATPDMPTTPTTNDYLVAVLASGTIGDQCAITIRAR